MRLKVEQAVRQPAEAARLVARAAHLDARLVVVEPVLDELEHHLERVQRRPQLVRRGGDEAPARVLLALQPLAHRDERAREVADLVAVIVGGSPAGRPRASLGDGERGPVQALDAPQHPRRDAEPDQPRDQQRGERGGEERALDHLGGARRVVGRAAQREHDPPAPGARRDRRVQDAGVEPADVLAVRAGAAGVLVGVDDVRVAASQHPPVGVEHGHARARAARERARQAQQLGRV